MNGWEIVIGVLIAAIVGVIYALIRNFINRVRRNKQQTNPLVRFLPIIFFVVLGIITPNLLNTWSGSKDKTFSKAGMTIVLTKGFYEKEMVSQTAYYESRDSIVTVLKEDFSIFEEGGISTDISLEEYADMVIYVNSHIAVVEEKEGLICFKYKKSITGKDFTYFATVFRGTDAYWLVQFACETKNYNNLSDTFIKWAKSFKV